MEFSSPETDFERGASRRKSGRVVKQPDSLIASSKRKRTAAEGEDADVEDASEDGESSEDGEPDEEELREQKKRARKPQKKAPAANKPAAKKAKQTNGEPVRLAIRSVVPKRSRSKKPQHKVADAEAVGGLYGK